MEWLTRLEQEQANLRAALDWALVHDRTVAGGDELALRLSGALRRFWAMRGHFHEGRSWLTKSLQQRPAGRTKARAAALLGKSLLAYALGDVDAARLAAEECAPLCRELGDRPGLTEALTSMGVTLAGQGEAGLAQARLEEALAICREAGDEWAEMHWSFDVASFSANNAPEGLYASTSLVTRCEEAVQAKFDACLTPAMLILMIRQHVDSKSVMRATCSTYRRLRRPSCA